jgi:hypothetical protein
MSMASPKPLTRKIGYFLEFDVQLCEILLLAGVDDTGRFRIRIFEI